MKLACYLAVICTIWSCSSPSSQRSKTTLSQYDTLRQELQNIVSKYKATVGIALMVIEDKATLSVNNDHHYPMQSVYKFPLAMAVLHQVDEGKYSLDHKMVVDKSDLH